MPRTTTVSLGAALLAVVALVGVAAVAVPEAQRRYGQSQSYYGNVTYDGKFTFVRMSYDTPLRSRRGFGREASWAHDYPLGEYNFLKILTSVSNVRAHVDESSIMDFSDPEMFRFPVLYLVEPGYWLMSDEDVTHLRAYLSKGGFLIVDDFPDRAWYNFEQQMARVFPDKKWIEITIDHPMFHSFFEIDPHEVPQSYNLGARPEFWALFEENDPTKRMLVIANYQNDLSEFWEYSDQGRYFVSETNESYKVGVNQFIYGITH
ncbi:MAG TPA: DUF4159 domain-containing protein [Vicinamibacterales bacterium]|nr:DUF4159 domain-containing protein [Vicinamibacterales bacterium]